MTFPESWRLVNEAFQLSLWPAGDGIPLTKKEGLRANWERVAVFSCDILNLQVQNSTSAEIQD